MAESDQYIEPIERFPWENSKEIVEDTLNARTNILESMHEANDKIFQFTTYFRHMKGVKPAGSEEERPTPMETLRSFNEVERSTMNNPRALLTPILDGGSGMFDMVISYDALDQSHRNMIETMNSFINRSSTAPIPSQLKPKVEPKPEPKVEPPTQVRTPEGSQASQPVKPSQSSSVKKPKIRITFGKKSQ